MTNLFAGLRNTVDHFLVDECTITKPVAPVFDPNTGYDPDDVGDTVYEGRCWVRPASGQRVVQAGEGVQSMRLFDVWLPWDTTGVEVDHLVTVTRTDDPHLMDRILRVIDVQGGSSNPGRKLVCEDTLTNTPEEVGS